jgi:hypothetical protein
MSMNQNHLVPSDHPENLMKFVTEDDGGSYNLCHFWSNFEVWEQMDAHLPPNSYCY